MEGAAELTSIGDSVDTISGQVSEMSMADSRYEPDGNESQSSHDLWTGDAKGREQEHLDKDQDRKDRELYEALNSERETLALVYSELEQERNCAATAASEALAMISRLQEEKAAVQLEARQFQRMVLEKAMYDQEAIEALNELLISREEEKLALEEEIQVYRERLDSVVREERRQSQVPKAKAAEGRIVLNSEQPVFIKNEKVNATLRVEQPKYVDKFSTTKSQLFTALIQDGCPDTEAEFEVKAQIGPRSIPMPKRRNVPQVPSGNIRMKVGKSDKRDEDSRFSRWGQDVAQKTLDQINEDRRIEERRLSVLEYVWRFEQQQREQGIRLPVQMSRPKSAGKSRSKSRGSDANDMTDSPRKDESTLRVLASDDSSQRRLFEEERSGEEHFGEEQTSNGSSSSDAEDGGRCEERPSCIGSKDDDFMDGEVCKGVDITGGCVEEALFVHDVYEVQKSSYNVEGPVIRDAGSLHNLADPEVQQRTPSDRLDKPDLHTFEEDGERDCEDDQETKCLIHPSHLHEEVDHCENDSQWEDLHGRLRYKKLRISSLLRMDNSRSGVEEELTHRLKALEADRYLMKQTIESLRRENEEMKLLQDLVQQLWELRGMEQKDLWPRTRMPTTLQFQDLMSFTGLRTPAQAHINKLAQACLQVTDTTALQEERSVGLGHLLRHSPKGLPGTCLTRVRKAEELIPSTTLSFNKEK